MKMIMLVIYDGFRESQEAQILEQSTSNGIWVGEHAYIDEIMGKDKTDYSLSYITYLKDSLYNNVGYIVLDLKYDIIKNTIDEIEFGDGSFIGFISKDGREISSDDNNQKINFGEQDFYNNSIIEASTDKMEGIDTVEYSGKRYRYIYSLNGVDEISICSLVPEAIIIQQADEVKNITMIIVIVACLIAGIIGPKGK